MRLLWSQQKLLSWDDHIWDITSLWSHIEPIGESKLSKGISSIRLCLIWASTVCVITENEQKQRKYFSSFKATLINAFIFKGGLTFENVVSKVDFRKYIHRELSPLFTGPKEFPKATLQHSCTSIIKYFPLSYQPCGVTPLPQFERKSQPTLTDNSKIYKAYPLFTWAYGTWDCADFSFPLHHKTYVMCGLPPCHICCKIVQIFVYLSIHPNLLHALPLRHCK